MLLSLFVRPFVPSERLSGQLVICPEQVYGMYTCYVRPCLIVRP